MSELEFLDLSQKNHCESICQGSLSLIKNESEWDRRRSDTVGPCATSETASEARPPSETRDLVRCLNLLFRCVGCRPLDTSDHLKPIKCVIMRTLVTFSSAVRSRYQSCRLSVTYVCVCGVVSILCVGSIRCADMNLPDTWLANVKNTSV